MIEVQDLQKSFRVSASAPGFLNNLRHFFHRKYRTVDAVKPLSFSIEPGEFVGFLGPNGAGKTTTLKMLSGLIHPSAGRSTVAGYLPFRRQNAFLKQITLVMGNKQQLIWDLPATETFRINGAVYDIPEATLAARVDQLAAMLGLKSELTQSVRKLSLGERMKCELMASLIHQPSVLFLDEPTLGLDINAQTTVRQFLRTFPATTTLPMMLQISSTSILRSFLPSLCLKIPVIFSMPLTKIAGPLAFPPNPLINSPAPRTKIVE